jgi:hypothetical protein
VGMAKEIDQAESVISETEPEVGSLGLVRCW